MAGPAPAWGRHVDPGYLSGPPEPPLSGALCNCRRGFHPGLHTAAETCRFLEMRVHPVEGIPEGVQGQARGLEVGPA